MSETNAGPPSGELGDDVVHLGATNRPDDLFMYLRRELRDGLEPDAGYRVSTAVDFASSAPSGCAGIGGAPIRR